MEISGFQLAQRPPKAVMNLNRVAGREKEKGDECKEGETLGGQANCSNFSAWARNMTALLTLFELLNFLGSLGMVPQ